MFYVFGTFVFAYACINVVSIVHQSMQKPESFPLMNNTVITICTVFYITFSIVHAYSIKKVSHPIYFKDYTNGNK